TRPFNRGAHPDPPNTAHAINTRPKTLVDWRNKKSIRDTFTPSLTTALNVETLLIPSRLPISTTGSHTLLLYLLSYPFPYLCRGNDCTRMPIKNRSPQQR
ncbi:unnamed protein product, partial [Ectocarpus sp. 8 AP-2014]